MEILEVRKRSAVVEQIRFYCLDVSKYKNKKTDLKDMIKNSDQ